MKIVAILTAICFYAQSSLPYIVKEVAEVSGKVVGVSQGFIKLKTSNIVLDIPTSVIRSTGYKVGDQAVVRMKKTDLEKVFKNRHLLKK